MPAVGATLWSPCCGRATTRVAPPIVERPGPYGAGGVVAGVGAIPPRPIWDPSGNLTFRNCPPLVPSCNGWIVTETFMPGVSVFGFQPSRANSLGPLSSIAHTSAWHCGLATFSKIQACGLVHWNSLTEPSRVTVLDASNIAKE